MSIFLNKNDKVMVQGITGKVARYHTEMMLEYGTNIVCGVSPFKGGEKVLGIDVYSSCKKAVSKTNASVSVIFVPSMFAKDAIIEAVDAGIKLIITITEHIPVMDMILVNKYIENKPVRLIGPNSPGLISSDGIKLGIMPAIVYKKGNIGIVSRSGTLTYEAADAVKNAGLGVSTAIGIGGDPVGGIDFVDVLKEFEKDTDTKSIIMIGEIGGNAEQRAALFIKNNIHKPVVAFIAGLTSPKGKRMGHAGAIVSGKGASAEEKVKTLETCGVKVAKKLSDVVNLL